MPTEYCEVVSPFLNRRIHRWRRLRQCFTGGSSVCFILALFALMLLQLGPALVFFTLSVICFVLRCIAHYHVAVAWLQRSRILCPACGYDLTPHDVQTCPECGHGLPADLRQRYATLRSGLKGRMPLGSGVEHGR